ncbi:MAG TPA: biopolymer transporter ExbD [Myxococcales bacterium]|jgi:biopolymer transport protein ExbD
MAMSKLPDGSGDDLGDGVVAEINITPLTDIFLVLLIIFMVTSSALVDAGGQAGVKVDLPKGGAREITATQSDLIVAILQDGRTVIGGKVMNDDELRVTFKEAKEHAADTTVIVQADAGVPHGRVVAVMELAKAEGLSQLAIATRAEGDSPP